MKILVTGARGMIGSHLIKGLLKAGYQVVGVDRGQDRFAANGYTHIECDLGDAQRLKDIFRKDKIDRVIHLAALAHRKGQTDLSWEKYDQVNVQNAIHVFDAAGDIPVLYISTVDVFGFTKGVVTESTQPAPVTYYGKSKLLAETECRQRCPHYDIFRFSPVYTNDIKRDIQKRYYLKYPDIAYQIGKGSEYEILNVDQAVAEMINWCSAEPSNSIRIVKDEKRMWTPDYIASEKKAGRAKIVLKIPRWMVCAALKCLMITGKNKYTYLLNKAVHPLYSK